MIKYESKTLKNGLRVLVTEDPSTPLATLNIMYCVGARDENPEKTGFAHLFEHLMFGGSVNIPEYDSPLQLAGGDNNAFTNNDITNYYLTLPANNLETGFWLESDRMMSLAFGEKSLSVQKKVVCEEFKEHYINKPYGDVWNKMRELAYTTHPYRWMTIGKELSHVENANMQDVKQFFFKHYRPVNAILVVAGHVQLEQIKQLSEKWFGDIPMGEKYNRQLPIEPKQMQARKLEVQANVPLDAFVKTWHMDARLDKGYYAADLATEILGGGGSSRLYQALVKEKQLFSSLDCHHFGSIDRGLVAIEGKLVKGVKMEDASNGVDEEIEKIKAIVIPENELQKVKNKTESVIAFEDMGVMSRANSLAMYELLGDANLMNTELERYQAITTTDIQQYCKEIFRNDNSNTLFYFAK